MPFDFKTVRPWILDWSYSNLCDMWEVGYETGLRFCSQQGDLLRERYHRA